MRKHSNLFRVICMVVMAAMLSVNAFAVALADFQADATTATLIINGEGTYDVYQLYDAEIGNQTYLYYENTKYEEWLDGVTAKQLSKYTADETQTFLNSIMGHFTTDTEPDYQMEGFAPEELPLGYYMIVQNSNAAVPGTVTSPILIVLPGTGGDAYHYEVTTDPKNSKTSLTKKIVEEETGNLVDTSVSKIGDAITYQIDSTAPAYGADVDKSKIVYAITDNPSEALDVKMDTIVVKMGETELEQDDHYTVTENEDGGFTVDFDYSRLSAGAAITIQFSAAMNENAVINQNTGLSIDGYSKDEVEDECYDGLGNPNGAQLEYTNNYYQDTTSKIRDIVTSYTTKFGIIKVDEDDHEVKLQATFGLYADENCSELIEELTTDASTGLVATSTFKPGTYYLQETVAPVGYANNDTIYTLVIEAQKNEAANYDGSYTLTADDTAIDNPLTIDDTENINTIVIENSAGYSLPYTGGRGIVPILIAGAVLIVGAVVALIVRRKIAKKNT